jgi:hypothetical protein
MSAPVGQRPLLTPGVAVPRPLNVALHAGDKGLACVTGPREMLLVWETVRGGDFAAKRGAHMCITELIDKLGGLSYRWAHAIVQLLSLPMPGTSSLDAWRLVDPWNRPGAHRCVCDVVQAGRRGAL